ncbi:dihydrolipoyl dehydrogenase, partial [bacterium]|nr:dihydrolipoyl dehydrogenase [bacterium]
VYTHPEVAGVGLTEEEALEKGFEIKTAKFPFQATGRARALGETRGFVKVIAEKKKDEILGVHMIGPRVSELIAEAVLAMEYRASAEDIARTCHAHPTLSEAFREAALAVDSRAIHM